MPPPIDLLGTVLLQSSLGLGHRSVALHLCNQPAFRSGAEQKVVAGLLRAVMDGGAGGRGSMGSDG